MLKKCYEVYSPQPGVTFYINEYYECFDLDVADEVESLLLDFDANGIKFKLRDSLKQFPNIKTIEISPNINTRLELSNFMFPNVELVKSNSLNYMTGPFLVFLDWDNKLLNTFCKKRDYVINLHDIDVIADYAFEGCMSTNIINGEDVCFGGVKSKSFYGSAYSLKHLNHEDILNFYGILAGIDCNADVIKIPRNIEYIPDDIEFGNAKVVFDNSNQLLKMSYRNIPKYVSIMKIVGKEKDIGGIMKYEQIIDLTIEDNNVGILIEDGLLLSKDRTIVYGCLASKSGEIVIPDGVETIGAHAFLNRVHITSVVLPESMRCIKGYAFASCDKLEFVHLNKELNEMGNYVFTKCRSLTSVDIPAGLTEIPEGTFSATGLNSVVIPKNIQWIHEDAFSFNENLKSVIIETSSLKIYGPVFGNVDEIIFADDVSLLPEDLFDVFNTRYHNVNSQAPVVKLKYKDKIVFVPRYIRKSQKGVLNHLCCSETIDEFFKDGRCDFMYEMAAEVPLKYFTALEIYLYNSSKDVGNYLHKVSKVFAQLLMDSEDEIGLIKFLSTGLSSKGTLNALLKAAQDKGLDTISAYILNAMNGNHNSPRFNL